jgi:hypothetical protein
VTRTCHKIAPRSTAPAKHILLCFSIESSPLVLFYYCLSVSASGQAQPTPKTATTPIIPPAGQPSVTPSAEPQLPESDRLPIGDRRLVAVRYAPVFEAVLKSKRSCWCSTTIDRSRHRAAAFAAWPFDVWCSNACRSMPQNATAIRKPYNGDCTQWSGSFLSVKHTRRYTFSVRGTVAPEHCPAYQRCISLLLPPRILDRTFA